MINFEFANLGTAVLWVTLILLLIFIIVYRVLLKKFRQGRIEKKFYITMYPIEKNPASGTVPLYIETYTPIEAEITITSIVTGQQKTIDVLTLKRGGNIIQIDTTQFENGPYYYQAETKNQKTRKRIEIRN